jgi:hypothetical protein
MSDTSLEQRIQTLEQQMQHVFLSVQSSSTPNQPTKDWRRSLGMFDDHTVIK